MMAKVKVLMGVACRKPQGWGRGTRYAKSQPDGLNLLARHIGRKCQCVFAMIRPVPQPDVRMVVFPHPVDFGRV